MQKYIYEGYKNVLFTGESVMAVLYVGKNSIIKKAEYKIIALKIALSLSSKLSIVQNLYLYYHMFVHQFIPHIPGANSNFLAKIMAPQANISSKLILAEKLKISPKNNKFSRMRPATH